MEQVVPFLLGTEQNKTGTMAEEWPLKDIAELHENDAVLLAGGSFDSTLNKGTARLLHLVKERRESVTLLSPFERPVVAVEITNTWRNQDPPGRFLNLGESGLYFDIGDKKAMQRISAALKIRETMVQEEVIADVEQSRFAPVQPDRKVSRRVSTQLDYRREGKLYNRSEQEKELLQAFHLVLDGSYSDRLVLISGQAGIGKTALASTIQSEVERLGGFFIRGKNGQMRGPNRSDAIRSAVAGKGNSAGPQQSNIV